MSDYFEQVRSSSEAAARNGQTKKQILEKVLHQELEIKTDELIT